MLRHSCQSLTFQLEFFPLVLFLKFHVLLLELFRALSHLLWSLHVNLCNTFIEHVFVQHQLGSMFDSFHQNGKDQLNLQFEVEISSPLVMSLEIFEWHFSWAKSGWMRRKNVRNYELVISLLHSIGVYHVQCSKSSIPVGWSMTEEGWKWKIIIAAQFVCLKCQLCHFSEKFIFFSLRIAAKLSLYNNQKISCYWRLKTSTLAGSFC